MTNVKTLWIKQLDIKIFETKIVFVDQMGNLFLRYFLIKMKVCWYSIIGGLWIFRRGALILKVSVLTYYFAIFWSKTVWKRRNLDPEEVYPWCPPLWIRQCSLIHCSNYLVSVYEPQMHVAAYHPSPLPQTVHETYKRTLCYHPCMWVGNVLSVCMSVCVSVCLSVYQSVCLSVCLSFCNSMPLVRLGLTICVVMSLYLLVWHRVYKITLLFVWVAPIKA